MTIISNLWAQRVRLATEVEAADQACNVAGTAAKIKAAEARWGALWEKLHDLDDELINSPLADQADVVIKAQVFLLRSNDDIPYLNYARRIAADLLGRAPRP